jgi:hypothetical protein
MIIKYILYLILATLNILFFKQIELFLLKVGLSWTFSKIFPYLFLLILGFLLAYLSKKIFKIKKLLFVLWLVNFIFPLIVGFILHPIYEGDFSKNGITPKFPKNLEFENYDLVVLTIPGCPFCHESVINSNFMLKRNPTLKIKYILCSSDAKEMEPYRAELDKKIPLVLAKDIQNMGKIAQGKFPSFILNKNNKPSYQWSNSEFGVRAKDLVENEISK